VNTVLVPLDGTSHATAALPVARALAEIESASLRVLYVGEPVLPTHELPHALRLEPDDIHALVLEQVTGNAAESIVRMARECQSVLIVMCTHTRQQKPRGAIGSVAAHVLQDAPCPVVLVRPQRGTLPWALRQIIAKNRTAVRAMAEELLLVESLDAGGIKAIMAAAQGSQTNN